MSKQNLEKFFLDPDWVKVEELLLDCLQEISFTPDSSTSPTDFKAQVLANKKLKEFLVQSKLVSSKSIEERSVNPFE
jgi:hypothetical protein